jgi:uroporphyrinogen-III decarboxylase
LLLGTQDDVRNEARRRIAIGKEDGGYILSTACSVAPLTPPANLEILAEVAETEGVY